MKLFFLLHLLCSAFAATPAKPLHVAVKFDGTFYELNANAKVFSYHQGPHHYAQKVRPCNKAKVDEVSKKYYFLAKAYAKSFAKQAPRTPTKFDVEVTDPSGKKMDVARGSVLGTWLRDLPRQIMYINADVVTSCRR